MLDESLGAFISGVSTLTHGFCFLLTIEELCVAESQFLSGLQTRPTCLCITAVLKETCSHHDNKFNNN